MLTRRCFVLTSGLAASSFGWSADPSTRSLHPLLRWTPEGPELLIGHSEMGQGVLTALCMLVADALDWPLERLRWDAQRYEPSWPDQGTSASLSSFTETDRYRRAALALRQALRVAAARRGGGTAEDWQTERGWLRRGSQALAYEDMLAELPAALPPAPDRPFGPLIGQSPARLDAGLKADGSARYGADIVLPGLLHAAWWSSPAGERVVRVDAPPGLKRLPFDDGVAVVAASTWQAQRALAQLKVHCERHDPEPRDDAELAQAFAQAWRQQALRPLAQTGASLAPAQATLRRRYRVGWLAHAAMEPMVATAQVGTDAVRLWLSTQHPERARRAVAQALQRPVDQVLIEKTWVGGGFGRKTYPDLAVRAARVAAALDGAPVRLQLSRAEDFEQDYLRPPSEHRLSARLGPDGRIQAWRHEAVAASVLAWWGGKPDADAIATDGLALAGVAANPYALPRFEARGLALRTAVRCGIWRSIGHFSSLLAQECFMDELASQTGQDALSFRLRHLAHAPRAAALLRLTAERAGWGLVPSDQRQGLALFHQYFPRQPDAPAALELVVVHVATLQRHGRGWRLLRIDVGADCGRLLHPDLVRAQLEGSVAWALTALTQGVHRDPNGRCRERGFEAFTPLRGDATPAVAVHLMPSTAWPAGVGEKGVPGVLPALLNAWRAATGRAVRELPAAGLAISPQAAASRA